MALALAKQRHQHVGAGNLVPAGALHVDCSALHHTLEARSRLGLGGAIRGEAGQIFVEKLGQILAELVEVHATRAQHGGRIAVVSQAEQEMFQSCIFVAAVAGEGERPMQRLFEIA